MLTSMGFVTYNGNLFRFRKNLYKDLIYISIVIDLKEKDISYEVIDNNTNGLYIYFYNNTNKENNLVARQVTDKFNKIIDELSSNKIIKTKRGKNDDAK